ncbi:hypothetical protein OAA64_00780 [bacterium]|nr:hypothetical protein [bacterium]
MSNLLERAIIDATALKEAALKNAEQLVIEKYSEEVKHAVGRLLEAPGDDPFAEEDPMADPMGMEDPMADPMAMEEPEMGMEDEDSIEGEQPALDPDSMLGKVPDAFNADDDEIIRIKLDSLEAEFEDEEGVFGGDDEYGEEEIGIDIEDDEPEMDIEDDMMTTEPDADMGADVGVDISPEMVAEVLSEMDLDEEEIDLEEVMEAVRVDFEPQKSGWAGTPESIMKEYESMLLAREQDSEVKEENEELRKNVAALQKENKTLISAAKKLQEQNKNFNATFETLQEKFETMNVSNAKLLYINQALENASLNERQKRKIVEAISKAETVQEAKIMFETLNDTVATTSDVRKEATLSEMVSRKSSLLVAARNEQPKKDANPLFNRMQALAGIKTH